MKVELTVQQLRKLFAADPGSQKALLALLAEGGSGEFAADLEELAAMGLVKKYGPHCAVAFCVDGVMPGTMARPKKSANAMAGFMAIWIKQSNRRISMGGKDIAALKRFSQMYSWEEFEELLKKYRKHNPNEVMEVNKVWTYRGKYEKAAKRDGEYEDQPEY